MKNLLTRLLMYYRMKRIKAVWRKRQHDPIN